VGQRFISVDPVIVGNGTVASTAARKHDESSAAKPTAGTSRVWKVGSIIVIGNNSTENGFV
jgi:hypothetical protein